jgi:hypothetical protein
VLPTVVKTSAPCVLANSAVSSPQLSATTTTLSGGLDCPHNDSNVALIVSASSCAGTSTVSRNGLRKTSSLSGSLLGGGSGSSASRTVDGPSGVNSAARSLRISGDRGGGIRRSRANTRIAAAAWRAASPTNNAAAATPAASISDTDGTAFSARGSRPTISLGSARYATHTATKNRSTVRPIKATASQLNRATRFRSGRLPSARVISSLLPDSFPQLSTKRHLYADHTNAEFSGCGGPPPRRQAAVGAWLRPYPAHFVVGRVLSTGAYGGSVQASARLGSLVAGDEAERPSRGEGERRVDVVMAYG